MIARVGIGWLVVGGLAAGLAAGVAGRFGGDGASVDDDFVSLASLRDDFVTVGKQLLAHRFDFALVEATANAVKIYFHELDFSVERPNRKLSLPKLELGSGKFPDAA